LLTSIRSPLSLSLSPCGHYSNFEASFNRFQPRRTPERYAGKC
jgi:hypothetical protein